MENEELGLAILKCLDSINEKQALIFKMKTIDGVDTETICNEFEITPSNLWLSSTARGKRWQSAWKQIGLNHEKNSVWRGQSHLW